MVRLLLGGVDLLRKQSGETIVEVLLAIAVLGGVIASSFAIANRSTQGIRTAQERGEALKIAESQLERLKYYTKNPPTPAPNYFDDGDTYCIEPNGSRPNPSCSEGAASLYTVSITVRKNPDSAKSDYLFTVSVTWAQLGGGNNNVTIPYKAYAP